MTILQNTFDWAENLYIEYFGQWLHINFFVRTVLLVLVIWLLVYIVALIFRYIAAPLFLLLYYHIVLRIFNFLFVETPQEIMYLNYSKKDRSGYSKSYARLTDAVKKNRAAISKARYTELARRVKPLQLRAMIICGIILTLWVTAFGVNQEYFAPAFVYVPQDEGINLEEEPELSGEPLDDETGEISDEDSDHSHVYGSGILNPAEWEDNANIVLYLNELGRPAARLRDGPGVMDYQVIEILWDEDQLVYLNVYYPDEDVEGLYWLRVLSPSGQEGYISSQVVNVR